MDDKCVLVIDDEFAFMEDLLNIGLNNFGFRVVGETDPYAALKRIESEKPDIVLLDILFPEGKLGKPVLEKIKQNHPNLPVVMLSNTMAGDDEYNPADYPLSSYRYAKEGYADGDYTDLAKKLTQAMDNAAMRVKATKDLGFDRYGFIVGETSAMHEVAETIEKVVDLDCTVLITGESGTGKELVARAIHMLSRRKEANFLPLVCAAVPKDLLESELFGIEGGVATGVARRIGKIEQASGGTLFLDEIGDVPMATQIKLLRLLQERRFQRVGGMREIACDARFITATNRDLKNRIKKQRFRDDLFHRINVVTIQIPPLRERKADIPALFNHFVRKVNSNSAMKILPILREDVQQILFAHGWPGNIRELENAIGRAIALAGENILQVKNFKWLMAAATAPSDNHVTIADIVDSVFEGRIKWADIRDEFAAANVSRRGILLGVIDRWKEMNGSVPSSKGLAKLFGVTEINMRQILRVNGIKLRDLPSNGIDIVPVVNRFCKEGEFWHVIFEGGQAILKDRVGLRLLAILLQNPGKEIHCGILSNFEQNIPIAKNAGEFAKMNAEQLEAQGIQIGNLGDAGEILTNETIKNYKDRLKEIRQELNQADEFNDLGRIERLQGEQEWLENELSAALGFRGKKIMASSADERTRQRISKALNSAKKTIERKHPALYSHLKIHLKIGTYSAYFPPDSISWTFE